MTLLAPLYLAAAGGLVALVVALHFIVTREPATVPFPTARFAPDRPVSARARAFQLSDLLLLLCRAALILAAGAALAQPILTPTRRPVERIILADYSASVADISSVRDSLRTLRSTGDVVVSFDSAAAAGSISAALLAALRAAVSLRDAADSLELALVSAFGSEEVDQATDSIRALWPGAIRLVRVAAPPDSLAPPDVMLVAGAEDPIRYALPGARGDAEPVVRVVRGAPATSDSAWARDGDRALVLWPANPPGAATDTVGAVSAGSVVVVAPFIRRQAALPAGRAIARWLDGAPAATETGLGAGCVRSVAIPVPLEGDLVLDPRFQRLARVLTGRCGSPVRRTPLAAPGLAALAGDARSRRVPTGAIERPRVIRSPLTPWLLAGALVLGLAELVLRRRRAPASTAEAAP